MDKLCDIFRNFKVTVTEIDHFFFQTSLPKMLLPKSFPNIQTPFHCVYVFKYFIVYFLDFWQILVF